MCKKSEENEKVQILAAYRAQGHCSIATVAHPLFRCFKHLEQFYTSWADVYER